MLNRYNYILALWEKNLEAEARKEEDLLMIELKEPLRMYNEGLTTTTEFVAMVIQKSILTDYKAI